MVLADHGPSLRVRLLAPDEEVLWDGYLGGRSDATLYHGSAWIRLTERAFGHRTYCLLATASGGAVQGVLPLVRLKSLLFGDYMVSLPFVNYGGVVADDEGAAAALLDAAGELGRKLGVSHIELRHARALPAAWPVRTDKVAMVRSLPSSVEALWGELGSKVRAQAKRSLREGAEVRHGGAELLGPFYRVFSANMRDLGTPVYSRRFFAAIAELVPDAVHLVLVTLDGQPAAAGLLLGHGTTLEIPWASSLRRFNRYGVNMLLYAEVLRYAVERGFTTFDFGRSTRGSSTYRFKQQWGGQERPLYWHYWLRRGTEPPRINPDNPRYALAIRAWRHLPLPVANTLGPWIVRNLP